MPLLDHFRPPVRDRVQWNEFHSNWATRIADRLTELLPSEFLAVEFAKGSGGVEIDVAAFRPGSGERNGTRDQPSAPDWQPPPATASIPTVFPERFEVRVVRLSGGRQLVGAIELISPGNKDSDDVRTAFAEKVASYIHEGVSVIVIDVVTERRANLHNEIARLIGEPDRIGLPADTDLYAVSYRPVLRDGRPEVDLWFATFSVGDPLPTMPLRLTGDLFVPVEFEATYTEACRRRRLI